MVPPFLLHSDLSALEACRRADDPFNLANVRSFKARGNHRLWQQAAGSRRRAEAVAETVTASAAGSRQQAAGDV